MLASFALVFAIVYSFFKSYYPLLFLRFQAMAFGCFLFIIVSTRYSDIFFYGHVLCYESLFVFKRLAYGFGRISRHEYHAIRGDGLGAWLFNYNTLQTK